MNSYGLTEKTDVEFICREVCIVLGFGANKVADKFLYRIAMAETGCGTVRDTTPNGAGAGIWQHDKFPFEDNQSRYKQSHIDKCKKLLNIDPSKITWEELKTDIKKGAIATRLHFKPIKEEIPADIVGQAQYWKKYYNTKAGKGSVKHFLEMNGFNMKEYNPSMEVSFDKDK